MKNRILTFLVVAFMTLSIIGCGKNTEVPSKEIKVTTIEINLEKEAEESKSKIIQESDVEITQDDFRYYFPEKIELNKDKILRITEKENSGGVNLNVVIDLYLKDDISYLVMNVNQNMTFKNYIEKNDEYVYFDMTNLMEQIMKETDPGELKKSYADEIGIPIEEITMEDIEKYFKETSISIGYSPKSASGDSTDSISDIFMDIDELKNAVNQYRRTNLKFCFESENEITAKYPTKISDVMVTTNKNTKEIEKITLTYKVKPKGSKYEAEETTLQITTEFLPVENMDISWITKDTKYTVDDVAFDFVMSIYKFSALQMN